MAAIHRFTAYTYVSERPLQVVCLFVVVLVHLLASCATSL